MQVHPKSSGTSDPDASLVSRRDARSVFALTFAIMVFNFIDRQIVVSVFPALKAEGGLPDKELGALLSVIDVTNAGLRAMAAAVLAFVQNIFGQAASPFVAGALSDPWGLEAALAAVPAVAALAALIYVLAGRAFERALGRVDKVQMTVAAVPVAA